jgi:hypothetical protein
MIGCGSGASTVGRFEIGKPVDVLIDGRLFIVTRQLTALSITAKTGQIFTELVVQPNCSVIVDLQPSSCDAIYSTTVIEDTLLAATGVGGIVRILGARATAAAGRTVVADALRFGPRSVGSAENTRAVVSGNLNKLKDSRLKMLGIDAEAVKKDILGRAGGKFNLSVDDTGSVFLTPVRPGAAPPVPTLSTLDQLAAEFPLLP